MSALAPETLKLLNQAKAKKGKAAALVCTEEFAQELAQKYLQAVQRLDELEREAELHKGYLTELLQPWHQEQCLRRKDYEPSVHVPTPAGTVQVTFKNQWSKIPIAQQADLQAALGDRFAAAFKEAVALKVKKEVADDPERLDLLIQDLARALGPDRFVECFEAERTLCPTEHFTKAIALSMDSQARQKMGLKQTVAVSKKAA